MRSVNYIAWYVYTLTGTVLLSVIETDLYVMCINLRTFLVDLTAGLDVV